MACDCSVYNVTTTCMYPGNHTWGGGAAKSDTCKHSNISSKHLSTSSKVPQLPIPPSHMAMHNCKPSVANATQELSSRQTAGGHRGRTSPPQSSFGLHHKNRYSGELEGDKHVHKWTDVGICHAQLASYVLTCRLGLGCIGNTGCYRLFLELHEQLPADARGSVCICM